MIKSSPIISVFKCSFRVICYVLVLGFCFAQVEIQIEGAAGWAANLPTWRIEKHWLLDILWGGRPMTGYHAWLFPFMVLAFHLGCIISAQWNWKLELRLLGALLLFWVIEDWLWFFCNPAFGLERFSAEFIPWHKHWILNMPADYLVMGIPGLLLILFSNFNFKQEH